MKTNQNDKWTPVNLKPTLAYKRAAAATAAATTPNGLAAAAAFFSAALSVSGSGELAGDPLCASVGRAGGDIVMGEGPLADFRAGTGASPIFSDFIKKFPFFSHFSQFRKTILKLNL